MTDKPYQERKGGSYVRDAKSGRTQLVESTRPQAPGPGRKPAAAEPDTGAAPATDKKGK